MECLLTFLLLLAAFIFVVGSAARAQSVRSRRRAGYQQLAKRFAGNYLSGGIFGRPKIRLRYGETTAMLREAAGRGPFESRCTQIVIDWTDRNLRCEILPKNTDPCRTLKNARRVSLEDNPIDPSVTVYAFDEQAARAFLCEGVCWQIQKLLATFDDRALYVLIQRGRILIQKPHILHRLDQLLVFANGAFGLYDQAMLTRAQGIEFMASDEAHPLEHVVCKVCGEVIDRDMVFCCRCKTPHHADCWQFNGCCSVYGCGETRYLRPRPVASDQPSHQAPSFHQDSSSHQDPPASPSTSEEDA